VRVKMNAKKFPLPLISSHKGRGSIVIKTFLPSLEGRGSPKELPLFFPPLRGGTEGG
jgi:hypothetical protein